LNTVASHFPGLSHLQLEQLSKLGNIYRMWNERINVISRKDINNLYTNHVLHSLAIARFITFKPGTRVLDAGTGGGFPGIPLAILFPDVQFTLADSIAKKITVVEAVVRETGLGNVSTFNGRIEDITPGFDFVVSRAVTTLSEFVGWTRKKIRPGGFNEVPNGIIYLKGGDLQAELEPFGHCLRTVPISDYFEEPFFETKKIIFLPIA